MKSLVLAALATITVAAPAQAVTLLTDDFNGEAQGAPSGGLANFDITTGTVDVVGPGFSFGISCVSGNCVDLDGSPGVGTILSKATFAYTAGLRYVLSFAASGSQRSGGGFSATDQFRAGFSLDGGANTIEFTGPALANADTFQTFTYSFTPTNSGSFKAYVGGLGSADNVGVVIDNVSLAAVPEPATWAMMIMGFGLIGAAMRRAKPRVNVAFA